MVTDVPGIGRYSVARLHKGSRRYTAKLNGSEIGLYPDKYTAMTTVENMISEMHGEVE